MNPEEDERRRQKTYLHKFTVKFANVFPEKIEVEAISHYQASLMAGKLWRDKHNPNNDSTNIILSVERINTDATDPNGNA